MYTSVCCVLPPSHSPYSSGNTLLGSAFAFSHLRLKKAIAALSSAYLGLISCLNVLKVVISPTFNIIRNTFGLTRLILIGIEALFVSFFA